MHHRVVILSEHPVYTVEYEQKYPAVWQLEIADFQRFNHFRVSHSGPGPHLRWRRILAGTQAHGVRTLRHCQFQQQHHEGYIAAAFQCALTRA